MHQEGKRRYLAGIFSSTQAVAQPSGAASRCELVRGHPTVCSGAAIVGRHYLEMSEDNDDSHYEGATSLQSTASSSFRDPKTEEKLDCLVDLLIEMLKTRREHEKNRTIEDQLYPTDECIKLLKSFGIEPHKLAKLLNKDYLMNFEFRKLLMGLEATYIKAFIASL